MPKTSRARRQGRGAINRARTNSARGTGKASQPHTEHVTKAEVLIRAPLRSAEAVSAINRPLQLAVRGPESLIFPAMVALGCWGIVIYFLFLTSEANHILFGGMAVLMALLWTFSFGTRVRKLLQQRLRT